MGGKGGGGPKPPPVEQAPAPDFGPMIEAMSAMMGIMGQQQPLPPQLPPIPEIASVAPIDFGEKINSLNQRMSATFNNEKRLQRGRSDTVLTSSLLDEEAPETTNSGLLSGSA